MRPCLLAMIIGAALSASAWAAPPQGAAGCPGDLRSTLDQACPCATFQNHGQYMNCVKAKTNELEKNGCDRAAIGEITRCASMSTCGEAGIVCCDARGRAKVMTADRCTEKGGTVLSGATSACYASCRPSAPGVGAISPSERPRHRQRARRLPPGAVE